MFSASSVPMPFFPISCVVLLNLRRAFYLSSPNFLQIIFFFTSYRLLKTIFLFFPPLPSDLRDGSAVISIARLVLGSQASQARAYPSPGRSLSFRALRVLGPGWWEQILPRIKLSESAYREEECHYGFKIQIFKRKL